MAVFDELKAYVGFSPEDAARLQRLLPVVRPHAPRIAAQFYEHVLRFPAAAAVFKDLAQVDRLKATLVRWINELLSGPHDDAYYALRLRIGRVHVRVGLPPHYMFTAMNRLMEELHTLAHAELPEEAAAMSTSLRRIADIELALMLGTYMETREEGKLADLRDLLLANLPFTVVLVDSTLRITSLTRAARDVFTLADTAAAVGMPLQDVLFPAIWNASDLAGQLHAAMETGHEIVVPRIDVELPSGRRILHITVAPLRHPAANALLQIEDQTVAYAREERARRAEHLAKLGTMAASVAHEIRNPLAGISATVQVVAASLPPTDPRVEALDEVKAQIMRLGNLVGDLLSFSRPATAQLVSVDLAEVARAAAMNAAAADGRLAHVEGAGHARADAGLLSQVLLNLIQNAWQAGARTVIAEVADGRVRVLDDGPGVPAELRDQIFEPFYTTKVRGTGLGLSVSRKMIDAMGATLALSTSRLGGACFEVVFAQG